MKIKKKTGLLLCATAAVAAVGVGAVSFAAWTGSNSTLSTYAATGSAYLFGFTTDQSSANMNLGTLVPYDQSDASIESGSKLVSVALPEYTVYDNYSITVKVGSGATTTMKFYVLVGEQQTALPTGAPTEWTDWKEATASGATFTFTPAKGADGKIANSQVTDTYVSLVMASNDKEDMNQSSISFSITLNETAPASTETPAA